MNLAVGGVMGLVFVSAFIRVRDRNINFWTRVGTLALVGPAIAAGMEIAFPFAVQQIGRASCRERRWCTVVGID